jgi:TMEM199 family protein
MVYLTITPTILEALGEIQRLEQTQAFDDELSSRDTDGKRVEVKYEGNTCQKNGVGTADVRSPHGGEESTIESKEPLLSDPKLGNPISHGQVIDLWRDLKARSSHQRTLDSLLRGTRVYNPPPQPKSEPVGALLYQGCHAAGI